MKKIGIIVEYNPFHNGHIYHLNKIKELNNDSLVIAIMSSSFTMRGDISIFDKFKKTEFALESGIDIVLELPFIYTVERADIFAKNAVSILNLLNVDEIIIGSEANDVTLYESYLDKYSKDTKIPFEANDNLGFFYYKAIKDNNYNIELKTIKREASSFNDIIPKNSNIASACAIRENINLLDKYTPLYVSKNKEFILDENKLFKYIKYKILETKINDLGNIFLVDEGIEYKLKDIYKFDSYKEYIKYLMQKRYSSVRIKRMLLYVLFNIKKDIVNEIYKNNKYFVRVLGFNDKGKSYISSIKKDINIITNIKEGINDILDIELNISKILDLIYDINIFKNEQKGPIIK